MAFIEGYSVLTLGVAFIEGCPHVRGGLYRGGVLKSGVAFIGGVLTSGVAFIEGCPHVRGGLGVPL